MIKGHLHKQPLIQLSLVLLEFNIQIDCQSLQVKQAINYDTDIRQRQKWMGRVGNKKTDENQQSSWLGTD